MARPVYVSGDLGMDRSISGSTTTYFIRNNTGAVIGEHVGTTSYYYLTDNEGSVVAVIDKTGSVKDAYSYDPYGQQTVVGTPSVSNPYGYDGGYEQSSGIIKFGVRYYDSTVGTFLQEDPSGQTAGYLYAGNDPANENDPSGLCSGILGCVESAVSTVGRAVSCVGEGLIPSGSGSPGRDRRCRH